MKNLVLFLIHNLAYWATSGIFYLFYKGIPNLNEYKIQDTKIDWQKYKVFGLGVLTNELLLSLPLAFLLDFYNLDLKLLDVNIFLQLPLIIILHDFIFYHFHRICHSKLLFRFHKEHHKLVVPVAIGGLYAGPIEHIFINTLPAFIPPKIINANYFVETLWIILATINVVMAHSGYKNFGDDHDLHHRKKNINFGLGLYICDRLYGTYHKVNSV